MALRFLLFFIIFILYFPLMGNKSFVIITASFNNAQWYQRNLDSIFNQQYENWRLIYIDDGSSDGTADLVQEYIQKCSKQYKVALLRNTKRRRHLYNQYHAIHSCKDDEIIVIVDGDDWLAHENVLSFLNDVYQHENVWLTYGQFKEHKSDQLGYCRQVPKEIVAHKKYRKCKHFLFGHLRTFYAGLFKKIKREDLVYNNDFFSMAVDVATMVPMAEMAGEHIKFIPQILYIHNDLNPLSFSHFQWRQQMLLKNIILSRPTYRKIDSCY